MRVLATGSPDNRDALAGREDEAAQISAAFTALGSGHGGVLEIAGDPGMGKTRLLGLLAESAALRGANIAWSNALRGNSTPFQQFRDVFADLPGPDIAEDDDESMVRAVRRRLADWAADGGGAVLLDDVHLGDEASTRLLARLIRTPVPGPLVLAVAHCPRRTGSVLLEALDDGVRTGTVTRVQLEPLGVEAVATLLAAWDGSEGARAPEFAEQVRAASDGNPRNLRILLAADWRPELWPDSPGPDTGGLLREAASMAAELDALPAPEAAVVNAAAVLAGPFRPQDAAEISGLGLTGTLDALNQLVRADLIRPVAPGGRFAFRHPLLGHVAHERAPLPVLLASHQRALGLLSARGASAIDLARHAEHLVGTNASAAAPLLARGATDILPDAPATAVRWLRLALETPVGERPSAERAGLMLECCRALSAAGQFDEARALAHAVLRDDRFLTGPLRLKASAMRVAAERQLGRYDEAEAVARAALEGLARPLPDGAAELAFEYGVLHMYRGTYRTARPLIDEISKAVKASATAGADAGIAGDVDAGAAASVRVLAAFGDSYLGDTAAAAAALVDCARLVDNLPDSAAARTPELLAMLGCAEMFMEGYAASSRHLYRCLTIAQKGGPQQMKLNVLLGLSYIDQQTGHLARSEQRALEAEHVARTTGADDGISMSVALRAGAMVWTRPRSESGPIVALAEQAVRIARPGNGWWSGSAAMQLALVRFVSGDAAGSVDALLDGGGSMELRSFQPAYRPMLLAMLSTAALRAGDPAAAREAIRSAEAAAEQSGLSVQRAHVTRAQAALHAADGDHAVAAALFEQAAVSFRRAGRPVQQSWTLAAGAPSAAIAHDAATASAWLDTAEEVARVHGAVRIAEKAAAARALLTAEIPAAPEPPAAPLQNGVRALLTAREQEIAALVATGRQSRAIADELFLSRRTVETHLARIYRKLDVSSRTALAHLLQDTDGVGPE